MEESVLFWSQIDHKGQAWEVEWKCVLNNVSHLKGGRGALAHTPRVAQGWSSFESYAPFTPTVKHV